MTLNLKDWLNNLTQRNEKSLTLKFSDKCKQDIADFVRMKAARETTIPISRFREDFLGPAHNYSLSDSSLIRYIKKYHPAEWRKIKENGGT